MNYFAKEIRANIERNIQTSKFYCIFITEICCFAQKMLYYPYLSTLLYKKQFLIVYLTLIKASILFMSTNIRQITLP